MEKSIIGITGTNGAGKGRVVDYLVEKGFAHLSMSGYIAEEVRRRGLEVTRDALIDTGNDLRNRFGADYVAAEYVLCYSSTPE